jgi:hypothetical protein
MTNPDVEVFLVSLKAGGVALNLTEASRVFIVDPWWNPAAEWQSAGKPSQPPFLHVYELMMLYRSLPPHRPKASLRHHPSLHRRLCRISHGDVTGEEGEYDQRHYQ